MHSNIRRWPAVAGVVLATALAALAQGPSAGAAPAARAHHRSTGTVHMAKLSVGRVLVDATGRTLYVFSADKHHDPTCSGACAGVWTPLLAGKVRAGAGVKKKWLGTVATGDGSRQVTYRHWPLYTYTEDTKAGQANGQGIDSFGGAWSTIGASGHPAFRKKSTTSSSSSGGTYGSSGTSGTSGGW